MELKTEELFIKLSRVINDNSGEISKSELLDSFLTFRREMMRRISYNWTVAEMAERLSFSKSRFFYLYRLFFGISPMDDLIRARIDFAKSSLLFTDNSVRQISESLGYANVTHFCRQFHQLVGITPTQYRKK